MCFKFVMPNSLNVSGRLTNERIPLTHAMLCSAARRRQVRRGEGGGAGKVGLDVALNSLLRASLSLKLSLPCKALKKLKMAKLRLFI